MSQMADLGNVAIRLRAHVHALTETIGVRSVQTPANLAAAGAYIRREFEQLGDSVELQTYRADGLDVSNIIVERKGAGRPDSVLVVGAHYDTVWCTPGADDNASAVAVMIETARLLKSDGLRDTVRFVAFTCEEPPHFFTDTMGSRVYAKRCRSRNENLTGMLCLEMVGYFSDEPGSQNVPAAFTLLTGREAPKQGNFLAAAGNLNSQDLASGFEQGFARFSELPLISFCLPGSVPEIQLSDNSSFWDQGYPALMITDTSFLRNPNYHEPTDRIETLDFDRMAQVACGCAGAVRQLCGGLPNG